MGRVWHFQSSTSDMSTFPVGPVLADCAVLGGAGFPFSPGSKVNLRFSDLAIHVDGEYYKTAIPLVELDEINIAGPGAVISGGGFIGGGFGVAGAVEGIAIAGVLNALTTRTKIHTFIALITNFGELHVHYAGMEPGALRIALSPVFTHLRRHDPAWLRKRTEVLAAQRALDRLDQDTHDAMARQLAVPFASIAYETVPTHAQVRQARMAQPPIPSDVPLGICPNCDATIPLTSEKCPVITCGAMFGAGSAWTVRPI